MLADGRVTMTTTDENGTSETRELTVPPGAVFDPNSRPDPYCAANILLRFYDVAPGESKEFKAYDWDNSGKGMADYTIRVENRGEEQIEVPAGVCKAQHLVHTQTTSGDTWYKKRAGHVTDIWVLENGVIARLVRHREPYELELLDYRSPESLPGVAPAPAQADTASDTVNATPVTEKRRWGPEQATGEPDTHRAGDMPTAWASQSRDAGAEWLKVSYARAVNIGEVRIRETHNPGAVSKVTAITDQGEEILLWEGEDPTTEAPADFVVTVTPDVTARSVKIYLETTRKSGWNEIDAVELVGKDGTRQWASAATASSTYASRTTGIQLGYLASDPLSNVYGKTVVVHFEGGEVVEGTLVKRTGGFIEIKRPGQNKRTLVNLQKMLYIDMPD
jgi:hypothetical protein